MSAAWDEGALLAAIDRAEQVLGKAAAGDATRGDLSEFKAHVGALRSDLTLRRALVDPAIVCGDGDVAGLRRAMTATRRLATGAARGAASSLDGSRARPSALQPR